MQNHAINLNIIDWENVIIFDSINPPHLNLCTHGQIYEIERKVGI